MGNRDSLSQEDLRRQGIIAAMQLLERSPDPAYIADWTQILSQAKDVQDKKGISVIIFRLGTEWLAVGSTVFWEVIPHG